MPFLLRFRDLVSGREQRLAYLIALLVTLASLGANYMGGDRVKSFDEPDFYAIAENLAFDGRYADEDGTLTAYRAPGLVFFATPFVRMGAGLMELRMIQALLVGGGLILLFHLIRRNAGPLAGFCAVALVPLWPVVLYASTTLYPQTLAAFLLVLTVSLLDLLRRNGKLGTAALAGLSYGVLLLTIPVVLLLLPVVVLWLLIYMRRALVPAAVVCVVAGATVGVWTLRNYTAFDAFIPVATSSGYNLMAGNAPNARFDTSLNVRFPEYVYTELTGKSEVERNDILTTAAIAEIRKDPERVAWLYLGKFLHWFDYSNRLMSDDVIEGGASSVGANLREMILLVSYGVILLPLLLRLVLLRRYPMTPVEVLGLALWITAGLAYAIFFTRVRFRLPFDWLILASNGVFLAAMLENYAARARERLRTTS